MKNVSLSESDERPVNLDLLAFKFPIMAIVSIMHRISGVILFFGSFILLALLHYSLESGTSFNNVLSIIDHWFGGFVIWVILASLAYHFSAGLKHLLMDVGYGETLNTAPIFAKISIVVSGCLVVSAGVWVW